MSQFTLTHLGEEPEPSRFLKNEIWDAALRAQMPQEAASGRFGGSIQYQLAAWETSWAAGRFRARQGWGRGRTGTPASRSRDAPGAVSLPSNTEQTSLSEPQEPPVVTTLLRHFIKMQHGF